MALAWTALRRYVSPSSISIHCLSANSDDQRLWRLPSMTARAGVSATTADFLSTVGFCSLEARARMPSAPST